MRKPIDDIINELTTAVRAFIISSSTILMISDYLQVQKVNAAKKIKELQEAADKLAKETAEAAEKLAKEQAEAAAKLAKEQAEAAAKAVEDAKRIAEELERKRKEQERLIAEEAERKRKEAERLAQEALDKLPTLPPPPKLPCWGCGWGK